MTAWLRNSSVPGMAVPGMAVPGLTGTGAGTQYQYLGHVPVSYLDYLDTLTQKTLSVVPGGSYSMIPVNSRAGLTVPPPDNCWLTPSNKFAPRVLFLRPAVREAPAPPGVLALDMLHGAQDTQDPLIRARIRNSSLQAFHARQPPREPPSRSRQAAAAVAAVPGPPSEGALALAAARTLNADLQARTARGEAARGG